MPKLKSPGMGFHLVSSADDISQIGAHRYDSDIHFISCTNEAMKSFGCELDARDHLTKVIIKVVPL